MRTKILALSGALLVATSALPQSAEAKDFMAFLRSVGNSIAHPQKHPPKHTKPAHPPNRSGSNTARQPTQPQQETSPAPADMSRDTAEVQSAPSPAPTIVPEPVVRSASASALPGGR